MGAASITTTVDTTTARLQAVIVVEPDNASKVSGALTMSTTGPTHDTSVDHLAVQSSINVL